ncbi:MAG: metalloregulator ArsR/SmtB family transcription factor [Alphaproteobacteria bacterium]|nr:metalloregulator ArsR/SmtB family transcription factor [Alphaproteobacteria bacterium]
MVNTNGIAKIGALVGDPARAAILLSLMDGRALTAKELAVAAGVTPQTASSHLARLTDAGLLSMEKQGRWRYHRLASPQVAGMLEGLSALAAAGPAPARPVRVGPRDEALRRARVCYDHMAGRLGVAVADALAARGAIEWEADGGLVTPAGERLLADMGVDLGLSARTPRARRPLCRPCLDWSERRPHVAGRLGAALLQRFLKEGYVRRRRDGRALDVLPAGRAFLRTALGVGDL